MFLNAFLSKYFRHLIVKVDKNITGLQGQRSSSYATEI